MRKAMIALLSFPFFALVSCQQPSTQQATSELCGNLAQLDKATNQLLTLTPTSTVGQFRTIKKEIDNAMANVQKSEQRVKQARTNELKNAYNNFNKTVQNISNRETLASAATSIKQSAAKVKAAEQQVTSSIQCAL